MRHFIVIAAMAALFQPSSSSADGIEASLATGCNETAFTSDINRGTSFMTKASIDRGMYVATFDSRGQASLGVGRIFSVSDFERHMYRYPLLTIFVGAEHRPGLELKLHNEWHLPRPNRVPSKWLPTVFETEAGIVWRVGHPSKVRVTHRFATSERRFPNRSRGAEWVWEFRPDFPEENLDGQPQTAVTADYLRPVHQRKMRFEQWAFISREVGFGVVRINLGATKRSVWRTSTVGVGLHGLADRSTASGPRRVSQPALMARIEFTLRRWW